MNWQNKKNVQNKFKPQYVREKERKRVYQKYSTQTYKHTNKN